MDVIITKPVQGGTVSAIPSKSAAHRLLICASLSDSETFITCPQRSEDINATIRCLQALGATTGEEKNGISITPVNLNKLNKDKIHSLDCGESGATLRFLLPVCGALGLRISIKMSGRLSSRPLSSLCDEMTFHGCKLSEPGFSPLTCEGQLKNGTYTFPGNITSQYISGLLFALPMLCHENESGESTIKVTGVLESRPYVDMTLDALSMFGINIYEEKRQIFRIPGRQIYRTPKSVNVEGDWSNAAFWLSAGAIGKNAVTCTGLNMNSRQGDRAITELLSRYGANVVCKDDTVTVSPGTLRGIDIDAGNIPDLVPVLSAVAASAEGKTVIRNAQRLRIKESDRLNTVAASLSALGADITETENGLVITGKKYLTGGETQSYGDHRIAMTAAVLSAVCRSNNVSGIRNEKSASGNVIIRNAEAVNKSYPDFFKDFKNALGGEYELVRDS